ncbi:hypothetical protein B0J13DRAFT_128129 [Dactylonectria estremocensis]|uniref:non-specific serine/threonine protein kinase n=1 Tax=Dactylonectria estremocensis TaxID=1079267 RepID=A0A9P9FEQ6_9HYPO|nr:hypothetical protein B0J13DRAFT_128129 [Dactylonectria estremocensis]
MSADRPTSQPLATPPSVFNRANQKWQQDRDFPGDITSTICVLQPTSDTACLEVQRLFDKSSPHVFIKDAAFDLNFLFNQDSPQETDKNDGTKLQPPLTLHDQSSSKNDSSEYAILLRLTTKPKNPTVGFTFGRHAGHCDVALVNDPLRRVSNMHFSIYVNEDGTAMIEDHSTNGTVVGNQFLNAKPRTRGESDPPLTKLALSSGMIIHIILRASASDMTFLVGLPKRDEAQKEVFAQNVKNYFIQHNIEHQIETRSTGHSSGVNLSLVSKLKAPGRLESATGLDFSGRGKNAIVPAMYDNRPWNGSGKYFVKDRVGQGASTTVHKVTSRFDGQYYVAKEIDKWRFTKNGTLDRKFYEAEVLKQLHHPNLVQYIEQFEWEERTQVFIMEYIPGRSLRDIVSLGHMSEATVRSVSKQLLSAVSYLHDRSIIHRDIKPDNIIVKSFDPVEVKLIDFGLSTITDTDEAFLQTFCGTLLYCAPEIYTEYAEYNESGVRRTRMMHLKSHKSRYSYPADIWSLGGTLFHTMTGSPPFPVEQGSSYTELLHNIMAIGLDTLPLRLIGVSEQAVDFLSRMLRNRPEARATLTELESHPWLVASKSTSRVEAPAPVYERMNEESIGVSSHSAPSPRGDGVDKESHSGKYFFGSSKEILKPTPTNPHSQSKWYDAEVSQAGESSKLDSGFVSRESIMFTQDHDIDSESIYSLDSVLPASKTGFIDEFSIHLASDIQKLVLEAQLPGLLDELLPSLLKTFAWKLHGESSNRSEREVSVFLHKHRGSVIDSLCSTPGPARSGKSSNTDGGDDDQTLRQFFSMPISEIGNWVSSLEGVTEMDIDVLNLPENYSTGADVSRSLPNLDGYKQFIESSQAYQWLLLRIKGYSQMDRSSLSLMLDIGLSIRNHLLSFPPLRKVSRHKAPVSVEMSFSLDWDLNQFILDQEYPGAPEDIFDRIICLTGTSQQAQAMTVSEYMEQTWPAANGAIRLLMKKHLSSPNGDGWVVELPKGSFLRATKDLASMCIVAKGQVDFLSDVGEQLGWLGSALRPSPLAEGIITCSPRLSFFQTQQQSSEACSSNVLASVRINFSMKPVDSPNSTSTGFCWVNMFRNPVLVTGYPTAQRTDPNTGVELSLSAMVELVLSRQFVSLDGNIFLKSFCSLLVATAVTVDVVLWHFLFNPTGERISYCDARLEDLSNETCQGLTLRDIEARRHVVGWCFNVKEYSGSPQAVFNIHPSSLPPPPKSMVIDKLYVEGGSNLIGGLSISIGKRDKPVYLQRAKSYSGLIDWISVQPLVFYDVEDQRAWLVDGASALLHLVRASIEQDRSRPAYRSKWRFNGTIEGNQSPIGNTTAVEVLSNFDNLNLPLYIDDIRPNQHGQLVEIPYYFRDRVQEIMQDVQVLVDYQAQIAAQDGYWFRQSSKMLAKSLVGFDFWDIAKPSGPIQQRAHYLRTAGHGWIDYVRSVKATTIFGKNFGDLLQVEDPNLLCANWKSVPTGMDYMGASIATLKTIQTARTGLALSPGHITPDIVWSSRYQLFSQCGCLQSQPELTTLHVDPVQLLLPKGQKIHLSVPKLCLDITLKDLNDKGAVVFGHTPYRIGPKQKEAKSTEQEQRAATLQPGFSSTASPSSRSNSDVTEGGISLMSISSAPAEPSSGDADSLGKTGSSPDTKRRKRSFFSVFRPQG